MAFEDLYQEIILDHYRHPRNYGEVESHCIAVEHDNPVCGDHIKLMVFVNDDKKIEEIKFSGSGCAISLASASMMTEEIKGKSISKVKTIINDVVEVMRGEKNPAILDEYGDITALKGVIKFPVRVKCATLSWHALDEALKQNGKVN